MVNSLNLKDDFYFEHKSNLFNKINVNFDKASGWQIEHVQEPKTVTIKDEGFLRRVRANEDTFAKGDLYTVKLKTIETRKIDGSSKVKYEITEVVRKLGE